MAAVASLGPCCAAMTFMALLVECGLEIDNGTLVFFLMARGAFFHGPQMVAINAFGVVFLHVGLVVELYLRQPMPCFVQGDNVFNILIFGFDTGMAFLTSYRASLFLMAVFAEIMEDHHL